MNEYIPGVCNIGKEEKLLRRNAGYFTAAVALALLLVLIIFDASKISRVILFPIIFFSILNYLQSQKSFCVKFGILGEYNFANLINKKSKVENEEFIKKDLIQSLLIILEASIISIVITFLIIIL